MSTTFTISAVGVLAAAVVAAVVMRDREREPAGAVSEEPELVA
ncbi:hypothetical protein [Streptomyces cahuitamycinicus]|nr:hypothetical protein [Streptomyces cahuitamycinicus]